MHRAIADALCQHERAKEQLRLAPHDAFWHRICDQYIDLFKRLKVPL